jgi:hypothetical protein
MSFDEKIHPLTQKSGKTVKIIAERENNNSILIIYNNDIKKIVIIFLKY